jgi:pilus assembly protein CpaB
MTPRTRRSLLMIFISLALATAAALLASNWMLDRAELAQSQRPTTQGLMIASRDLSAGTRLESDDVQAMQVVTADRPMGSFISKDEIVGQIVTTELRAGELVLAPHLSEDVEGSALAALLSPNMRAVAVRVDDVVGVAGFILPGNHVDVIATRDDGRQTVAQTLLSNVRVLAVDQQASADPTTPQVVRAVTLEVTPQGAEAIARARHQGQLQLSLRHPRDGRDGPTLQMAEVTAPSVDSAAAAAAATVAPAPTRPRQSTSSDRVEVLRGTHRSRSGG